MASILLARTTIVVGGIDMLSELLKGFMFGVGFTFGAIVVLIVMFAWNQKYEATRANKGK